MHRNREGVPSKWTLATRILEERRGLLARLAGWEKRSPVRDGRGLTGDNTPLSELVETALRLMLGSQRKRAAIPQLPTFRSGGALVDIADRDALYHAMEGR